MRLRSAAWGAAILVSVSLGSTGCQIRVEDPSLTSASMNGEDANDPHREWEQKQRRDTQAGLAAAQKRFANARRAVEAAESKATSPNDAEKEHLAARSLVFKTFRDAKSSAKNAHWPLDALMEEAAQHARLDQLDAVDPDAAVALELLWRTFLGRTAALRALKRDAETVVEGPGFPSDGHECKALAPRCGEHLVWLKATHPYAFKMDEDRNRRTVYHRREHDLSSADTPTFFNEWVDVKQKGLGVVKIAPSAIKKHKDGFQIVISSDDIAYSYGEDCQKVLKTSGGRPVVEDGKLVVEERCAKRGRDVAKGRTIRFITRSVPDVLTKPITPEMKVRVDLAVDMSTVRKSAGDRDYTLTGAIVVGASQNDGDTRNGETFAYGTTL